MLEVVGVVLPEAVREKAPFHGARPARVPNRLPGLDTFRVGDFPSPARSTGGADIRLLRHAPASRRVEVVGIRGDHPCGGEGNFGMRVPQLLAGLALEL